MLIGLTFRGKILIFILELLKVFLHPPPPQFATLRNSYIRKCFISQSKKTCQNRPLTQRPKPKNNDFHLKSSIISQNDRLWSSGETVEKVPKLILGEMQKKMTSQNAPQSTISSLRGVMRPPKTTH